MSNHRRQTEMKVGQLKGRVFIQRHLDHV